MNELNESKNNSQYTVPKFKKCCFGHNIFLKYQVIGIIGSGSNKVYKGRSQNGQEIAIKEIYDAESMFKEMKILEQLNHPNIIEYLDSCVLQISDNQYHQQQLGYICMELAIYDLDIYKSRGYKIEDDLIDQTLSAFSYLQQKSIAHCDIKPANILISQLEPIIYKICDVGSSKHQNSIMSQKIGTYKYMSPEMLNEKVNNYFLSDVFSLGLVYLYLFKDIQLEVQQRRMISEEEYIKQIHSFLGEDDISKLLKQMLKQYPEDRLDFIKLELYWQELKQSKIEQQQSPLKTTQNRFRIQSNFTSIFNDSPTQQINNTYYKTGRFSKNKVTKIKNSCIVEQSNFSPVKKTLQIERRNVSNNTTSKYSKYQNMQQIQFDTNFFQTNTKIKSQNTQNTFSPQKIGSAFQTESPIKGENSFKIGNTSKQSRMIQLPLLKKDRQNSIRLLPI